MSKKDEATPVTKKSSWSHGGPKSADLPASQAPEKPKRGGPRLGAGRKRKALSADELLERLSPTKRGKAALSKRQREDQTSAISLVIARSKARLARFIQENTVRERQSSISSNGLLGLSFPASPLPRRFKQPQLPKDHPAHHLQALLLGYQRRGPKGLTEGTHNPHGRDILAKYDQLCEIEGLPFDVKSMSPYSVFDLLADALIRHRKMTPNGKDAAVKAAWRAYKRRCDMSEEF